MSTIIHGILFYNLDKIESIFNPFGVGVRSYDFGLRFATAVSGIQAFQAWG